VVVWGHIGNHYFLRMPGRENRYTGDTGTRGPAVAAHGPGEASGVWASCTPDAQGGLTTPSGSYDR
jgi:hypothetical protein